MESILTNPERVRGEVRPVGQQLGEGVGLQLVGGLSELSTEGLAVVRGLRVVEGRDRLERFHANPIL